jgi:murein DD-endopeptidase MepM/ murein hydrolase activator NlpD
MGRLFCFRNVHTSVWYDFCMKKPLKSGIVAVVVVTGILLVLRWENERLPVLTMSPNTMVEDEVIQGPPFESDVQISTPNAPVASEFMPPVPYASDRITKKPFGIHITKSDSPVRPERFSGYHTGTDFEMFPDEANVDVSVSAICSGALLYKRFASGYGGVAVQSCGDEGQPVTVVYGHLRLSSMQAKVGERIQAGDFLGHLGTGYTFETDSERKHLHLGIHRGPTMNILGYVQPKAQLSDWIDPCTLVCHP